MQNSDNFFFFKSWLPFVPRLAWHALLGPFQKKITVLPACRLRVALAGFAKHNQFWIWYLWKLKSASSLSAACTDCCLYVMNEMKRNGTARNRMEGIWKRAESNRMKQNRREANRWVWDRIKRKRLNTARSNVNRNNGNASFTFFHAVLTVIYHNCTPSSENATDIITFM